MIKIVLTGGGTAGHAMVNQVLAKHMQAESNLQLLYIGSHGGAERAMMEQTSGVTYFPISTGKLRRYLSFENVKDFFRVWQGIAQAYRILKQEAADVVFSGGGFVSLPVVLAAHLLNIPVLIRETDITMGLANRICTMFAQKIFTTFPDTLQQLQEISCECTGIIVRPELLQGLKLEPTANSQPKVLVMGGSLGSQTINETIWDNIDSLSASFQLDHLCGRGQVNAGTQAPDYAQYDYVSDMASLYAAADVVVTRCGSNALSEGLALGKRMVCIPISTRFSRGEQLDNAKYAVQNGCAVLLEEDKLSGKSLETAIREVLRRPLQQDCVLSQAALQENCTHLRNKIYAVATVHFEQQIIKKVKRNQIDWNSLSPWEFRLCAEIAEEYCY